MKLTTVTLSLCLIFFGVINAFAYEDGDWQIWNTESIEGELAYNWKVKIEEEFRFGDNMGEFYYHHTDGGLTYRLTDYFYLGMNYRQIYEKKAGGWEEENRPHINGTVKCRWLTDRNRFEYRIRSGSKDVWRYRNKLTLAFPFKWTELDIQPYLADEIFVDIDNGSLNRNRLYVGFRAKLITRLRSDIFYLWQSSKKEGTWTDYNVIGIKLKVIFE